MTVFFIIITVGSQDTQSIAYGSSQANLIWPETRNIWSAVAYAQVSASVVVAVAQ